MTPMKSLVIILSVAAAISCGDDGKVPDLPDGCGDQLGYSVSNDYSALAKVLNDDVLRVDMSRSRDSCGYLGIEADISGSCGGRWLQDDVIDITYSVLIKGVRDGVQDGVVRNDINFSQVFPYLPGPHI